MTTSSRSVFVPLLNTHQLALSKEGMRGHVKKPSVDFQNFVEIDVQKHKGRFLCHFISEF